MADYYHPTPLGTACITEHDGLITAIRVCDDTAMENNQELTDATQITIKQLDEYFAGKRQIFDLPLKQQGTNFQQQVWQYLQQIPFGETISYMQLSQRMQNPLAIRAIAAANGKNNLWIVVPCHRVIGTDGSLTGYAGGLWRKQWLLRHEVQVAGYGQLQMQL
ncbi:methylated-DNA--[protein]-cysteine S-methyltransferase [Mucilaginibacter robiniae]|uniref:Methylated-DNA--protein-cysteine methyltransferase n=1 Tax=Mucilaginibacter robiniae TaxID=2728022 RepID=A0A7L5E6H2_9SPHI|nr:methylated-DNA--[protein]-cysteine S-methyltransferase [Mucilaginibacter robiniae]QJD97987.1 methylated-DNA--[protein]-cysteine S-methyltransferase [Mucilaginibacter robiniae]